MIKTFDLHVQYIDGTVKHYTNLSRVAVKRYKEYFEDKILVNMILVKDPLTSH